MIEGLSKVHSQCATDAEQSSESPRATSTQAVEVFRDDGIRIVSDRVISQTKASALAREIEAAYQWDEKQFQLAKTPAVERPLTVAVLSQGAFPDITEDATGLVARGNTGSSYLVVPEHVLAERSAQDKVTLDHELEQGLSKSRKKTDQIPTYLLEGCVCLDENRYAKNQNVVQRVLGQLRGQDVATVLANFRHERDERPPAFVFVAEITGALMVEYLRTKLDGKGLPDALKRLSKVIEDVGDGKSFHEAVHKQFQKSLVELEKSFISWVTRTEGDPRKRLDGTRFEPSKTPPSKPKPKPKPTKPKSKPKPSKPPQKQKSTKPKAPTPKSMNLAQTENHNESNLELRA